jgi:OOP family OmpA-OmpF porin
MKVKLHKLGLGLAASVVLFAALPAQAQVNKYGCIYAVDPYGVIVRDPYGRCIRPSQPAKRSPWAPTRCSPSIATI